MSMREMLVPQSLKVAFNQHPDMPTIGFEGAVLGYKFTGMLLREHAKNSCMELESSHIVSLSVFRAPEKQSVFAWSGGRIRPAEDLRTAHIVKLLTRSLHPLWEKRDRQIRAAENERKQDPQLSAFEKRLESALSSLLSGGYQLTRVDRDR